MRTLLAPDARQLGKAAATIIADKLNRAIVQYGTARIILSTGASQFQTIDALVNCPVDWSRVTMFHLDEYMGLPVGHPASFRRYLQERFVARVPLGRAVYVEPEGDLAGNLAYLSAELKSVPVDVGVIGIGENAHIAFNDPPADFDTDEAYVVVALDEQCRRQQVGEGWFATLEEVPKQAITMTPRQIMACKSIVAPVPDLRKARAVHAVLQAGAPSPQVPASLLSQHSDCTLLADRYSASLCATGLFDAV